MEFTTHLELHSQTTRLVEGASRGTRPPAADGVLTLCDVLFQGTWTGAAPEAPSPNYNSGPERGPDFKFELLPLHSPLLRQSRLVSCPPLIDMLKFSGYPCLIRGQPYVRTIGGCLAGPRGRKASTARQCDCAGSRPGAATAIRARPPRTREGDVGPRPSPDGLEGCNDARTGMPPGMPGGAMCVQRFDDSLNSAIHITYRISLRSSSMPEPRDPLLKVLLHSTCASDANQTCGVESGLRRGAVGGGGGRSARAGPPRGPAKATRAKRQGGRARARGPREPGGGKPLPRAHLPVMIPLQVHLQRPCYDFYFL